LVQTPPVFIDNIDTSLFPRASPFNTNYTRTLISFFSSFLRPRLTPRLPFALGLPILFQCFPGHPPKKCLCNRPFTHIPQYFSQRIILLGIPFVFFSGPTTLLTGRCLRISLDYVVFSHNGADPLSGRSPPPKIKPPPPLRNSTPHEFMEMSLISVAQIWISLRLSPCLPPSDSQSHYPIFWTSWSTYDCEKSVYSTSRPIF